tara:strand:+ start:616 stop:1017 length:402 start_codon:yes stop_codon:yes gene_type:complete
MNWEYITGFFDGDGSISLVKKNKSREKSPQISFHNNELNILIEIQEFILKELKIKGFISKKKKVKEHHGQQHELKYDGFPKCITISKYLNTKHHKKAKRIALLDLIHAVTPRNGKYNEQTLKTRAELEFQFFN